jgi:hypothetical protein
MLMTTAADTGCKQLLSKTRDRAKTAENGSRYALGHTLLSVL